jgi:hypothetical protein
VALPDPGGHGPLIPLAGRIVFPVRHYLRQQPERTEWLAQRLRPMCDLIEYWNSATGGNEHPERTLKEEALAEWEAISRRAKRRWAEANGHDCISLQHDGIALALRPGVAPAHVAGCLGDFASLALGYPMPVTLEAMEHADLDPPPPVLDSVGWSYLGGGGVGPGGGPPLAVRLQGAWGC